ncbi:MAG: SH3 domain-containing protein [Alphaproteobacteria bacterium]|nr:SH3 domain-containing protein [Alphaproteobacteria bacterium]
MRTLALASVTLAMVLACGGGGPTPDTPEPTPVPDPEPVVEAPPVLDGFAYVPGDPPRFSEPEPGDVLYVGVDGANLREGPDGEAPVVAELAHAEKVEVVAVEGPPVELIGRTNRWVKVKSGGHTGYLFGSLLTPLGGKEVAEFIGDYRWTVGWSQDFRPLVRVSNADGEETQSLELGLTQRFQGGTLVAEVGSWGDFDAEITVTQCVVGDEPADGPGCVTGRAVFGGNGLTALTPPDAWRYEPEGSSSSCEGATSTKVQNLPDPERLLVVNLPSYMRGPGTEVPCDAIATLRSGPHAGKRVVACAQSGSGKEWPPQHLGSLFVLLEAGRWGRICGGGVDGLETHLGYQRVQVVDIGAISLEGPMEPPREILYEDETGKAVFRNHWPESLPTDLEQVWVHPELGPVYRKGPATKVAQDGLLVARPDGGFLQYAWVPDLSDLSLDGGATGPWVTDDGMKVDFHEPGLAPGAKIGTAAGQDVYSLDDPAIRQSWVEAVQAVHRDTPLGELPWFVVKGPFDGYYLVMREDLRLPSMVEPIVYAYADEPTPVSIRFGEGLDVRGTLPRTRVGWDVVARPDGMLLHEGRMIDRLFWDGQHGHFPRPPRGWMLPGATVERDLRGILADLGLEGREIDEAVEAWMPSVEGARWVRVGLHEDVDRLAPLVIDPEPDTLLRVLVELERLEEPEPIEAPDVVARERRGLTVVEWGYVER